MVSAMKLARGRGFPNLLLACITISIFPASLSSAESLYERQSNKEPCPKILSSGKCPEGFNLNKDLKTCSDIDECEINNGGCQHECNNICGGYICSCRKGFLLDKDQHSCKANDCFEGTISNFTLGSNIDASYRLDRMLVDGGSFSHSCASLDKGFGCNAEVRCQNGQVHVDVAQCCAHCHLSSWEKGDCSKTCGEGFLIEKRTILTPPTEGGNECGTLQRQIPCNHGCCPVNCELGDWITEPCSTTCGCGAIKHHRPILVRPACGGEPCGPRETFTSCQNDPCDDGTYDTDPFFYEPDPNTDNLSRPSTKTSTVLNGKSNANVHPSTHLSEQTASPTTKSNTDTGTGYFSGNTGFVSASVVSTGIVGEAISPGETVKCTYRQYENVGKCSGPCGPGSGHGVQNQVSRPLQENCNARWRKISCEPLCGVETVVWKATHCSGVELDSRHIADHFSPTSLENCREQPGETDPTAAIANCIELCNSISQCAGFTFAQGDEVNRCCFHADTSIKQHDLPDYYCFEKSLNPA